MLKRDFLLFKTFCCQITVVYLILFIVYVCLFNFFQPFACSKNTSAVPQHELVVLCMFYYFLYTQLSYAYYEICQQHFIIWKIIYVCSCKEQNLENKYLILFRNMCRLITVFKHLCLNRFQEIFTQSFPIRLAIRIHFPTLEIS